MMIMVVVISIMESSESHHRHHSHHQWSSSSSSRFQTWMIATVQVKTELSSFEIGSGTRSCRQMLLSFFLSYFFFLVINIFTIMVSQMHLNNFLFLSKVQSLQSWISYLSPEMLTLVTKNPVKDLSCLIFPMWVYLWGCFLFAKNHFTPVIACLNVGWFYISLRHHH